MGTHFRGTPRERRALDSYVKLSRASESVSASLAGGISSFGLSHTHLGVLEALHHLGPLCQTELARRLLRSPANMTAAVDQLEERGLVRRGRGHSDRRRVTVRLTARGRDLVDRVFPGHVRRIVATLAALTPSEQTELGRLCRKLGLSAARTAAGPEALARTMRRPRSLHSLAGNSYL